MKALVAGWFSFEYGHATAGDLLTRDLACSWLAEAGFLYDVAVDPPFSDGVNWREVDPEAYSHVVFVCGPFEKRDVELSLLYRFAACRLIGLNLSMLEPLKEWNPFDFLIERDSSRRVHPDMAFLTRQAHVPVVGVCLVEDYPGADVSSANAAIERLLDSTEAAVVPIDTRLDVNGTGLRTSAEVESLLARMDAVVTTRLHGMVLALKNGVPALAIDPERGGAKIKRQAERIHWPLVASVNDVTDEALRDKLDYCLSDAARARARQCASISAKAVDELRAEFISELANPDALEQAYSARIRALTKDEDSMGSFHRHGDPVHQESSRTKHVITWLTKRCKEGLRVVGRPVVEPIWRWLARDESTEPIGRKA